jgi:hypothetical protein
VSQSSRLVIRGADESALSNAIADKQIADKARRKRPWWPVRLVRSIKESLGYTSAQSGHRY